MNNCLECGKEIPSEVTQCPHCHAMLDSHQGTSEHQEDPPSLDSMSSSYQDDFSTSEKGSFEGEGLDEQLGDDILSQPGFSEEHSEQQDKNLLDEESVETGDENESSYSESFEEDDDMVSSSEEHASGLSDLKDFANSEESSAREGEFFYDVTVSEIDSEELRLAFQEAITDSKFRLDVSAIMSSIKEGIVTIRHINPVKASVLIQRIKIYSFKINWKQSSIYET